MGGSGTFALRVVTDFLGARACRSCMATNPPFFRISLPLPFGRKAAGQLGKRWVGFRTRPADRRIRELQEQRKSPGPDPASSLLLVISTSLKASEAGRFLLCPLPAVYPSARASPAKGGWTRGDLRGQAREMSHRLCLLYDSGHDRISGVVLLRMLTRPEQPDQSFTLVQCCGSSMAPSPRRLATTQLPSTLGCLR